MALEIGLSRVNGRRVGVYERAEPEYLDQFDLVIATQLDEAPTKLLGELCLAKRIPLLVSTNAVVFVYNDVFD